MSKDNTQQFQELLEDTKQKLLRQAQNRAFITQETILKELASGKYDQYSSWEDGSFREQLGKRGQEEQKFIQKNATHDKSVFSLRMLHKYGNLDIKEYLEVIRDIQNLKSSNVNARAYNVEQGEFAIVKNTEEIGTTNIQQCVAVIIKGQEKTALAHFDRFTKGDSLKQKIQEHFGKENKVDVYIYGAKDLSDKQKGVSKDNIQTVLNTLNNFDNPTLSIKEMHIPQELTKELQNIPTEAKIIQPISSDIIFRENKICTGEQPTNGQTTLPIRILSRRLLHEKNNHDYSSVEIKRDSELRNFDINSCNDLEQFKSKNNINYSIQEKEVFQKLFDLEEKSKGGSYTYSVNDNMIYNDVIPYYDGMQALKKVENKIAKEHNQDNSLEKEQLITLLNKMSLQDIAECIRASNKSQDLINLMPESLNKEIKQEIPVNNGNAFNQRLNEKYEYQDIDIERIAPQLIKDKANFGIYAANNVLGAKINSIQDNFSTLDKPIIGTYNKGGGHWTTFAIVKDQGEVKLLYKDSLGGECPEQIKEAAKLYADNRKEIITIENKEREQGINQNKIDLNCGIYALTNAKLMYDNITSANNEQRETFINNFAESKEFNDFETVSELRKSSFAEAYVVGTYDMAQQAFVTQGIKSTITDNHKEELQQFCNEKIATEVVNTFKVGEHKENKLYLEIIDIKIQNNGAYSYQYQISSPAINPDFKVQLAKLNLKTVDVDDIQSQNEKYQVTVRPEQLNVVVKEHIAGEEIQQMSKQFAKNFNYPEQTLLNDINASQDLQQENYNIINSALKDKPGYKADISEKQITMPHQISKENTEKEGVGKQLASILSKEKLQQQIINAPFKQQKSELMFEKNKPLKIINQLTDKEQQQLKEVTTVLSKNNATKIVAKKVPLGQDPLSRPTKKTSDFMLNK